MIKCADVDGCYPICDFCKYYNFNSDENGAYTGDGMCEHPDHQGEKEPFEGCEDYHCFRVEV